MVTILPPNTHTSEKTRAANSRQVPSWFLQPRPFQLTACNQLSPTTQCLLLLTPQIGVNTKVESSAIALKVSITLSSLSDTMPTELGSSRTLGQPVGERTETFVYKQETPVVLLKTQSLQLFDIKYNNELISPIHLEFLLGPWPEYKEIQIWHCSGSWEVGQTTRFNDSKASSTRRVAYGVDKK